MHKYKNFSDLSSDLEKNEKLRQEFEDAPQKFIANIQQPDPRMDKNIFVWVIIIIGCVLIFSIVASTFFIFKYVDKPVPTFLVTIGSTALGALVGLLTPSPNRPK